MNRAAFIEFIEPQLHEFNIKLVQVDGNPLPGDSTLGYFCCHSRELAVNATYRYAFQVLVHEYAHFLQWRDRPFFFDAQVKAVTRYFEWLESHKPVTKEVLLDKSKTLMLEWDCERRAIKVIDELGLRISRPLFIRKANLALLTYHMVTSYHRWPDPNGKRTKILNMMPSELLPLSQVLNPGIVEDKAFKKMVKVFR